MPHLEKDGGSYFITFHTGNDLTLNNEAKWLVLGHCLYDDSKRYNLESVVVMRTHVHLILTPLPDGLGYFRGSLWMDESFDHLIRPAEDFEDKSLYIAMTAVETGARSPQEYPWYWRRGMRKPKPKEKIRDPWLSGE